MRLHEKNWIGSDSIQSQLWLFSNVFTREELDRFRFDPEPIMALFQCVYTRRTGSVPIRSINIWLLEISSFYISLKNDVFFWALFIDFKSRFVFVPVCIRSKAFTRGLNRARNELALFLIRSRSGSKQSQKRYGSKRSRVNGRRFWAKTGSWSDQSHSSFFRLGGVSNSQTFLQLSFLEVWKAEILKF